MLTEKSHLCYPQWLTRLHLSSQKESQVCKEIRHPRKLHNYGTERQMHWRITKVENTLLKTGKYISWLIKVKSKWHDVCNIKKKANDNLEKPLCHWKQKTETYIRYDPPTDTLFGVAKHVNIIKAIHLTFWMFRWRQYRCNFHALLWCEELDLQFAFVPRILWPDNKLTLIFPWHHSPYFGQPRHDIYFVQGNWLTQLHLHWFISPCKMYHMNPIFWITPLPTSLQWWSF